MDGMISATKLGFGLLEAHRLAHELNGALIEAAALSGCIRVLSADPEAPPVPGGVWTAVLRFDLDGPGGAFVMVAPSGPVSAPGDTLCTARDLEAWNLAARRVAVAVKAVTSAGLPVAVHASGTEVALVDDVISSAAPGQFTHSGQESRLKAPLAFQLTL
ncbi:hypothetical protein QMO56_11275 [Roseomonas sp. E05]|uniref:hypothetical protein n=1 Tax=Roseomonas sp. E05 TaxID=3046310 RepID=UPI0024BA6932|nr:hypothetical protein [Roseomonas sp. E05]MDJ0388694.1 hypothetical protein [Roseomonas sp. E05]